MLFQRNTQLTHDQLFAVWKLLLNQILMTHRAMKYSSDLVNAAPSYTVCVCVKQLKPKQQQMR